MSWSPEFVRLTGVILLTFLTTLALTRAFIAIGRHGLVLDVPNARSLHRQPTPRSGGLAVLAGVTLGWLLLAQFDLAAVVAIGLALAGISLVDDLRGLPVAFRLAAHVAAATALVWVTGMKPNPIQALAVVFGVVWAINLYNFMDGADGLAGGMALFGFSYYAAAASLAGNLDLAAVCAIIAAAAAAFLVYNLPPARIFLGDVGAIPLGFLAVALGLIGWLRGDWHGWFPLLVFSPFWVDASVTLTTRLCRGEKVWQAHREHAYQRLVLMGLGHRGTAWLAYLLMAGGGALGLLTQDRVDLAWLGLVWCAGLVLGALAVGRAWDRRVGDGTV